MSHSQCQPCHTLTHTSTPTQYLHFSLPHSLPLPPRYGLVRGRRRPCHTLSTPTEYLLPHSLPHSLPLPPRYGLVCGQRRPCHTTLSTPTEYLLPHSLPLPPRYGLVRGQCRPCHILHISTQTKCLSPLLLSSYRWVQCWPCHSLTPAYLNQMGTFILLSFIVISN